MLPSAFVPQGYTSSAAFRRAGRAARVTISRLACLSVLVQGCNASDANAPDGIGGAIGGAAGVSQSLGTAVVGATLDAPVRLRVTGRDGAPISGAAVRWEPSHGGTVSTTSSTTDAGGLATVRWTLGTAAGEQTLVAVVAGLTPVVYAASAVADRPASIRFAVDEARTRIIGDTVRLQPVVRDRFGNQTLVAPALSIENGSPVVSLAGDLVVARSRGVAVVRAIADTVVARLSVVVDPRQPVVTRVAPDTLRPGVPFVIEGEGFAMLPDAVSLSVGGASARILSSSTTRVEAVLPTSMPCRSTELRQARVIIGTDSASVDVLVQTAVRISLAPGESRNLLDSTEARCTEIVAPEGSSRAKYVMAVINTSASPAATAGFELRGTGLGAMAGQAALPVTSSSWSAARTAPGQAALAAGLPAALADAMATDAAASSRHGAHLEAQRAIRARYGSSAPVWSALRRSGAMESGAMRARAERGDTVVMKALYGSCQRGTDIRARVVYAGSRAVVLEDVRAPQAGAMDAEYRAIGEEFERVQYPLLVSQVGDPLAMDGTMGGDGRVTMLFTRYVNDSLPGIAGYVSACNLYPAGTFAGSNQDEVFYARVPAAGESASEWRRGMRSTVVHEAKHLASFAERLKNGTPFEESWLEESTARVAEELYARTFAGGGGWKTNAGFSTVRCEVYRCDDRPLMMWKHFSVLHQFMRGVDTLTPIGAATSGDYTWYASGWSFVRWSIDHYADQEGAWLKGLVRGGSETGLAGLARQTGRPAGEMLADWALATAVDDATGFTPERATLSLPSWNVTEVMNGLAAAYPGSFVASPLRGRAMSFGSFSLAVPRLRGFSSSYFSFEGSQAGSQLLELRGEGAAEVTPSTLRVAVVRLQ